MQFSNFILLTLSLGATINKNNADLDLKTPSPFGTILIAGMAKKVSKTASTPSKVVYKVYTKGRLSTAIHNKVAKDSVLKFGHPSIVETDSKMENFKTRFTYFRTAALQNITVGLEFRDAVVLETKTRFTKPDLWVGLDGNFKAEIEVEIDKNQKDIHYNVAGVPQVSTYVTLTEDEGFAIVADVDDTIKETGVMWGPSIIENSFFKKYKPCLTLPAFFSNLTGLVYKGKYQPSFHYLSGTPQQFLPAIQPFIEYWYPTGEFVLPPLAKSNQGGLKGFLDYKNFKIRTSIEIIKAFPQKQIILMGDSTQFDAEAYATVYEQYPNNVKCIWIRISEGYSIIEEAIKNPDSRFIKAFEKVPRERWATFRLTFELPTVGQIAAGKCRID